MSTKTEMKPLFIPTRTVSLLGLYAPKPYKSPHKLDNGSEAILRHKVAAFGNEIKEPWNDEKLVNLRRAEIVRRIYQEEKRRKYLQELQDTLNRIHADTLTPAQKSPIPLNRYDDVLDNCTQQRSRSRTPEPKLVARAVYNFVGLTSKELTFRKGDIIFVKRRIDKNWYEGEHNAMIGLFPLNYVEIIPYDEIRTTPRLPIEGQGRAKFNFMAQSSSELSLIKGELVVLIRRVDENWYEGRIGNRRGIFPVLYVHIIREPGSSNSLDTTPNRSVAIQTISPIPSNQHSHVPLQHSYQQICIYRSLYNYQPKNEDELELQEGDIVYVMEKCDDGWYIGSNRRTSNFGTFPGNYVRRVSINNERAQSS